MGSLWLGLIARRVVRLRRHRIGGWLAWHIARWIRHLAGDWNRRLFRVLSWIGALSAAGNRIVLKSLHGLTL